MDTEAESFRGCYVASFLELCRARVFGKVPSGGKEKSGKMEMNMSLTMDANVRMAECEMALTQPVSEMERLLLSPVTFLLRKPRWSITYSR